MAASLTTKELRAMPIGDLQREIKSKRLAVAKMRIEVALGSHKDTAQFRREKRSLAQLLTIEHEQELKNKPKTATIPAYAQATSGKPAHKTL